MRTVLIGLLVFATAGCMTSEGVSYRRVLDLSHTYDESTIYWPTEKGFVLEKGFEGTTPAGYFYTASRF